jgi:CubicO group peptidase (beta-lactamase class C family)
MPRRLVERPLPLGDLRFEDGQGGRTNLTDFLGRSFHDALLVVHRGVILFEHYANGMTAATPHMLFSITKSLIGIAAERLIASGRIDPAARVAALVPELAGSGFAPASLRHLLDMTDGVAFDENYADANAQVHLYSAAYWTPAAGSGGALAKLSARDAEPGATFRYRTPVADVMAWMLRRACGKTLAQIVADEVWIPAGCDDEAYMLVDTAGSEMGGTGLNATARDLARIATWMLEPAQRPLTDMLLVGGSRALFAAWRPELPASSYRSLWWIDHRKPPTLTANGVFGQRLWVDPAHDLAVITLGSYPLAGNSITDAIHRSAFAAVRERLISVR